MLPRRRPFAPVAFRHARFTIDAIGRVELYESLGSLRDVIGQNWSVNTHPELFCFGLLEAFDIIRGESH